MTSLVAKLVTWSLGSPGIPSPQSVIKREDARCSVAWCPSVITAPHPTTHLSPLRGCCQHPLFIGSFPSTSHLRDIKRKQIFLIDIRGLSVLGGMWTPPDYFRRSCQSEPSLDYLPLKPPSTILIVSKVFKHMLYGEQNQFKAGKR